MRRLLLIAALLFVALTTMSCARWRDLGSRFGGDTKALHVARVAVGDDPRWSDPKFNDAAWPEWLLYPPPLGKTVWMRAPIVVPKLADGHTAGLYVSVVASFEVFVDGVLIGRGGTINADGSVGKPGPIDNFFVLSNFEPGEHLLALRMAPPQVMRPDFAYYHGITVGDFAHMARARTASQVVPAAGLGVFVVVGLYYLALWFSGRPRRPSILIFSLLCFAASLLVMAETWRWLVGYTYDWHLVRLQTVNVLTFAVALLLPLFFVLELGLQRPWVWAATTVAALLATNFSSGGFDHICLLMFWVGTVVSTAAIVMAIPTRRWETVPSAGGITIIGAALLTGGYGFNDRSFFIAFCGLIVCLLISMAIQMQRQSREHESARLRAARLEIELLKKTIQPHFLMNTLTAVMEWIEENPPEGLLFLESLAEELRIFADVSGETLIPMRRELELCRSHLKIMSFRKGTRFTLHTDGVDAAALMPPAIFHTLIENALTHNRYRMEEVLFTLREVVEAGSRTYVLDAPLDSAQPLDAAGEHRNGLGLRYVHARLEESFPGRWRVVAGEADAAWRTMIEVPA